MPRGRPPVPAALNKLRNDPGHRRKNCVEPKSPSGAPKCPTHLDKIAKQEWKDITHILKNMGLLFLSDKTMLEMYCCHYSRWRNAQEKAALKPIILSPNKQFPMKSPWASEADQQHQIVKGMLIEFGLSPAARSRMRINIEEKPKDKTAALLQKTMRIVGG